MTLRSRRARATYICSIADDPIVQKVLPQILIGNVHCFSKSFMREAAALCPRITLWRAKSAWNCHKLMKDYIRLLCEHLGDLLRLRSVYLLLDLAPCHIHDSIYELAKGKGLRLLFVPPSMTFLLQPTDTHCFSHFKFTVEEAWREQKGRAAGGQVTLLMWTKIISDAIETLPLRDWRHAFQSDGILDRQQFIAPHLLANLGWAERPEVASAPPNEFQARHLFPKNWSGNAAKYILWDRSQWYIRTLD